MKTKFGFLTFSFTLLIIGCSSTPKNSTVMNLDDQLTQIEEKTKKSCENFVFNTVHNPTLVTYKIEKGGQIRLVKIESEFDPNYQKCVKENIEKHQVNLLDKDSFETSRRLNWFYNYGSREKIRQFNADINSQRSLKQEVALRIKNKQDDMFSCAAKIKPEVILIEQNNINIKLNINKNGSLASLEPKSDIDADAEVLNCFRQGLQSINYPSNPDGKEYSYNYEFLFISRKRE